MEILDNWFQEIKNCPRLNFEEAKKLYIKINNSNSNEEKEKLRDELIRSTLYVVLDFVKNSSLEILENSSYDLDDIIDISMEYFIKEIDNGAFLQYNSFNDMFQRKYFEFLSNKLALPIKSSNLLNKSSFADVADIYLKLKEADVDNLYAEFEKQIKQHFKDNKNDLDGFASVFVAFDTLESVYSKVDLKDISKRKLEFMRLLLLNIEEIELINEDEDEIEDERDQTSNVVNSLLIDDIVSYIDSLNVKEEEKDIYKKYIGLYDGQRYSIDSLSTEYNISTSIIQEYIFNIQNKVINTFNREDKKNMNRRIHK